MNIVGKFDRHIHCWPSQGGTSVLSPLSCASSSLYSCCVYCVYLSYTYSSIEAGGGRVVRWCWVNFQCRGVLLILIIVGQGPTALAVGAVGVVWIFFRSSIISLFFLPLWETARYRLKYCLKGPLNPKQPTNHALRPPVLQFQLPALLLVIFALFFLFVVVLSGEPRQKQGRGLVDHKLVQAPQ